MINPTIDATIMLDSSSSNSEENITNSLEDTCYGATEAEMEVFGQISFNVDVILQSIIGIFGIAANMAAVPILCSRQLRGMFFQMLACLATFDSFYIVLSIAEAFRRHYIPTNYYVHVFCYLLYPAQNVVLCCTIYVPVALAIERYRAIRHPVEYHNAHAGSNPFRRACMSYIIPVILLSILICLPKGFEIKPIEHTNQDGNNTFFSIGFTDLRFNPTYVLWYNNFTKLLTTGILPFLALIVLNVKIFQVIKRRNAMSSRLVNSESKALKSKAANQAYVLFAICGLFGACHLLRIALAIHEFVVLEHYRRTFGTECNAVKFYTLVCGTMSGLMLTMNSSLNFVIYALMSSEFRDVLKKSAACIEFRQRFCWTQGISETELTLMTSQHDESPRQLIDHVDSKSSIIINREC